MFPNLEHISISASLYIHPRTRRLMMMVTSTQNISQVSISLWGKYNTTIIATRLYEIGRAVYQLTLNITQVLIMGLE